MKTETCKLYSSDFWIFLPNIKIDHYNSELYRFKVVEFFLRRSVFTVTVHIYISEFLAYWYSRQWTRLHRIHCRLVSIVVIYRYRAKYAVIHYLQQVHCKRLCYGLYVCLCSGISKSSSLTLMTLDIPEEDKFCYKWLNFWRSHLKI